jgi:hypothetical protein
MRPTDKYKMFRNFMVNELEITREDIERWTKDAVAEEVKKISGQMDIHGMIERHITRSTGIDRGFVSTRWEEMMRQEIASVIKDNLSIEFKPVDTEHTSNSQ